MSYLETPEVEDAAGATAQIYTADLDPDGRVPNHTRAFGERPEVYRAWAGLNGAIRSAARARHYRVATVAAAAALRSSYCSLAHGTLLAREFLGEGGVIDLLAGRAADPVDAAIADFAAKVASGAATIDPRDVQALRDVGLSDPQILDVVLAVAARCFFSTVLDATGTLPDSRYSAVSAVLRDALVVGRPIAADGAG